MILALLVLVPAVAGLLVFFLRRGALPVLLAVSALHWAATVALWVGVGGGGVGLWLELDATGRLFLSVTSLLFLLASLYTIPYVRGQTHDRPAALHRLVPCLLWFLSATTLVAATQHLALLWAAVEATTLASAPLVYFYRRPGALEAAWKYLILCSVGIALALLGTFFLGIAATAPATEGVELTLPALKAVAPALAKPWLKAAFVFALVGYGTKMGLAPLHTWLPDTHSQAPSPVSALLSGTVLNCALLGVLRFHEVVLASGEAGYASAMLIGLGLFSVGVAAAFLVGQRDYKRLFAYSSVENMGVAVFGIGLGGPAAYGALLHVVNHSLCKAGLFFLSGNVLRAFGTTAASEVRGVLRRLPVTGALLAALLLAVGGSPPFGPFVSEFTIFQSAVAAGHTALGVLFVALLGIAFIGMAGVVFPMLQGESHGGAAPAREAWLAVASPLVVGALVLALGAYIPPFLSSALREAARALGG